MNATEPLDFLSPVSVLPKFGPRRLAALAEAGIETVRDLLYRFPRRYIDRSRIIALADINQFVNQSCTVSGVITRAHVEQGRRSRLRVQITDADGYSMEALWFAGVSYLQKILYADVKVLLTGTVTLHTRIQMVHPLLEILTNDTLPKLAWLPRYALSGEMRAAGIGQKFMQTTIDWIFSHVTRFPAVLPPLIEQREKFPPLAECLKELHAPRNPDQLELYRKRIDYETLFELALLIHASRRAHIKRGMAQPAGELLHAFRALLPFTLSAAQEAALAILLADMAGLQRMHRLLQGDVGCGKTVVAFMTALCALQHGRQAVYLAPTETLARQIHATVTPWLTALSKTGAVLLGSTPAAKRTTMLRDIASGACHFVVGTHALLEERVHYPQAGILIIDEQHKFGLEQRQQFFKKAPLADLLLMSATPIPQTLAQTLYSDLELATITALPHGRKPVATRRVPGAKRHDMEAFIALQLQTGNNRAIIVVPRIESDDDDDAATTLQSAEDVALRLKQSVLAPLGIALLHGRIDTVSAQRTMQDFVDGRYKVLVATTVIEVGVDIPAASIMVVENADCFGLAQLHQLRGRVGRGGQDAWCFVIPGPHPTDIGAKRLDYFCKNHDGFAIADEDLRLRGPGEVLGAAQSGFSDERMAIILKNGDLFRSISTEIAELIKTTTPLT